LFEAEMAKLQRSARCGQACYGLLLSRVGQRATTLDNTHIKQDFQKPLVGKLHMVQWSDNSGIAFTRQALLESNSVVRN